MKFNVGLKTLFIGFWLLTALACQNQPVSNSSNSANSSTANSNAANQSPAANQTNAEIAKVAEPQKVKFESAEKAEIVGTFYESPKPASPAVLLLHQWQSDRKSFNEFARRLQAKGFGVLAIDGRGFGESTKTTDGKSIAPARDAETVRAMKADVENAFRFLKQQKNVDAEKIGIVGASYGSSLAVIYAAENSRVRAIALVSPGLNYFGNLPTEPAVEAYGSRPLLFVTAQDDPESTEAVRKLMITGPGEGHQLQLYRSGGHGTALFAAKVGLEDLLEKFLIRSLQ